MDYYISTTAKCWQGLKELTYVFYGRQEEPAILISRLFLLIRRTFVASIRSFSSPEPSVRRYKKKPSGSEDENCIRPDFH